MKALSIQQPWPWLILRGYKTIENRTWKTPVRGRIAIHAGKQVDRDGFEWVRMRFPDIPLPPLSSLAKGGIVGTVIIGDCYKKPPGHNNPWYAGNWAFTLHLPEPCPFIPYRGELGFFDVPDDVLKCHLSSHGIVSPAV